MKQIDSPKYNVFSIARAIAKNTNIAINSVTPWFLRKKPRIVIVISMVLLDGITTFMSLFMKLSASPLLTIVLTLATAFLLNVPQELAAHHLVDYIKGHKKVDLVFFVIVQVLFVSIQIPLSIVKISIAPDLVGVSSTLAGSTDISADEGLVYGMAFLLIVSSIVSSVVCFSLGYKDETNPKKKTYTLIQTMNKNFIDALILIAGAKVEFESIRLNELNEFDEQSKTAFLKIIQKTAAFNKVNFRDRLTRHLNPDGVNDLADESKQITAESKKEDK